MNFQWKVLFADSAVVLADNNPWIARSDVEVHRCQAAVEQRDGAGLLSTESNWPRMDVSWSFLGVDANACPICRLNLSDSGMVLSGGSFQTYSLCGLVHHVVPAAIQQLVVVLIAQAASFATECAPALRTHWRWHGPGARTVHFVPLQCKAR